MAVDSGRSAHNGQRDWYSIDEEEKQISRTLLSRLEQRDESLAGGGGGGKRFSLPPPLESGYTSARPSHYSVRSLAPTEPGDDARGKGGFGSWVAQSPSPLSTPKDMGPAGRGEGVLSAGAPASPYRSSIMASKDGFDRKVNADVGGGDALGELSSKVMGRSKELPGVAGPLSRAIEDPFSNRAGGLDVASQNNPGKLGVAELNAWSAALTTEARRLERHGMQTDKDSIILLRQQAEKMGRVKEAVEARDEEIRRLRAQVTDLSKSRDALQVLRSQVELLEDRCKLRDEQAQEARAREKEQQGLLQRSMEVESSLRAKLAALEDSYATQSGKHEKQVAELSAQVGALRADAERREGVRLRLEDGLKLAAKTESTLAEREETLSNMVRSLKADMERMGNKCDDQSRELEARANRIADLQTEATLLTSRLREKDADMAAADRKAEEKERQLGAELAEVEEQRNQAVEELRREISSLDEELERSRERNDILQHRLQQEQKSADEAAASHADAISDLEEQLRASERQLAQAREEHEARPSSSVAAEHAGELNALRAQLEMAHREAAHAHEEAARATSACDAAERRVLQVVTRTADEASVLRHILQRMMTAATGELPDYGERDIVAPTCDGPELPDPAGVAMATLGVAARSAAKAVREIREREARVRSDWERCQGKLEEAERVRRSGEEEAAELRKLLRDCEGNLHRVESEGEVALREAARSLEDLHRRCLDAEAREECLSEAVRTAAQSLFAVPTADICRLRGDDPTCSTPAVSYKHMPESPSVSALQVILTEQVQRVALSHRQLLAAWEDSSEEVRRCIAERDDASSAAERARDGEVATRKQVEALIQSREDIQREAEEQAERYRREIQEMSATAAEEQQVLAQQHDATRAELMREVSTSRGTSLRLLAAVQLLARFAIPLRLRSRELRWQKAFLTKRLEASQREAKEMDALVASLHARCQEANGQLPLAPLALPSNVAERQYRRKFRVGAIAVLAARRLWGLLQTLKKTRGASAQFGRAVKVGGEVVGLLPLLEAYGGDGVSIEERILAATDPGSAAGGGGGALSPRNRKLRR